MHLWSSRRHAVAVVILTFLGLGLSTSGAVVVRTINDFDVFVALVIGLCFSLALGLLAVRTSGVSPAAKIPAYLIFSFMVGVLAEPLVANVLRATVIPTLAITTGTLLVVGLASCIYPSTWRKRRNWMLSVLATGIVVFLGLAYNLYILEVLAMIGLITYIINWRFEDAIDRPYTWRNVIDSALSVYFLR